MPSFSTIKKTTIESAVPVAESIPETNSLRVSSIMPTVEVISSVVPEVTITTGCVKWFNNKAGYGFITVTDTATDESRDIFVHHTAIQVSQSQYKYLVQGEYVELTISPVENATHEIQVSEVRGLKGGRLMCETRNEMRSNREEHYQSQPQQRQTHTQAQAQSQSQPPQTPRLQRSNSGQVRANRPPQLSKSDETEWMVVPRRKTTTAESLPPAKRRQRPQQRQPTVELQ